MPKIPDSKALRIGDVALATGLSRDALRFYEREGLIRAKRSSNGYREYPRETVELLKYVQTAQRLGFTLAEIGESVPRLWQSKDTEAEIVRLLEAKLAMVEGRIVELRALKKELKERLAAACANRLAEAPKSVRRRGVGKTLARPARRAR